MMPVLFQQPQAELDCVIALDAMAAQEAANNAVAAEPIAEEEVEDQGEVAAEPLAEEEVEDQGEEANIRFEEEVEEAFHACAEQEEVGDHAEDEERDPFPDGHGEELLDEQAEELLTQAAERELAENAEAHDAHAEQAWYEGQEPDEQLAGNGEWEEANADSLEMQSMLEERYAGWDEEKKRLDEHEAAEALARGDGGNSDAPEEAQGGICSS
jgi:hypothetical protein